MNEELGELLMTVECPLGGAVVVVQGLQTAEQVNELGLAASRCDGSWTQDAWSLVVVFSREHALSAAVHFASVVASNERYGGAELVLRLRLGRGVEG